MQDALQQDAYRRAEVVARDSYGRLLALLAARSRDLEDAEDALAEAFREALRVWPERGAPQNPEGWLITVAKRRLSDGFRRDSVRERHRPELERLAEQAEQAQTGAVNDAGCMQSPFPDERLNLLFVCAHPGIDPAARTPLMLQCVLGLEAERIAAAFLTSPAAMGQRLARAKQKIKLSGLSFRIPAEEELPERLDAVLQAIYGAFGLGWLEAPGAGSRLSDLSLEALSLIRLVTDRLSDAPEALGLHALLLFCESRRKARRDSAGGYVPLRSQKPVLWNHDMIAAAQDLLRRAAELGAAGRFQLEAAIQAAHTDQIVNGRDARREIALLYAGLAQFAPTPGVLVSRAAAVAEWQGPEAGLELLDELPEREMDRYQPYWAVRAALLKQSGRIEACRKAAERAIGLCDDPAVRVFLLQEYDLSPVAES